MMCRTRRIHWTARSAGVYVSGISEMNTLKAALADWQNLMVRKCSWARSHSALQQGSTWLGEHGIFD